jgi:hypothetical protein
MRERLDRRDLQLAGVLSNRQGSPKRFLDTFGLLGLGDGVVVQDEHSRSRPAAIPGDVRHVGLERERP